MNNLGLIIAELAVIILGFAALIVALLVFTMVIANMITYGYRSKE